MILTLVTWPAPPEAPAHARSLLEAAAPAYREVPGLRRKWFIGDGVEVGGVYEWDDRASAERWFDAAWRVRLRARYGAAPSVRHFEVAGLVDNIAGDITFRSGNG